MDGILPGVRLAARSRIWHTAPLVTPEEEYPLPECLRALAASTPPGFAAVWAKPPAPWYANMAVRLDLAPEITPEILFEALMALEAAAGRNRIMETRWGPRIIDIDLLAFGAETRATPRLTLPHPRLLERAFVLLPLSEIAPDVATAEILAGLSFTASGTMLF